MILIWIKVCISLPDIRVQNSKATFRLHTTLRLLPLLPVSLIEIYFA